MDSWLVGWLGGWMDGWMDGWMEVEHKIGLIWLKVSAIFGGDHLG
jgi:hypothetical protein